VKAKAKNPIDKHVGNLVRLRRVALNMSQTALADELGVSFQQVQKYEKGTNRIGASRLQNISSVLGMPVGFFFERVPGGSAPRTKVDAYLSEFLASADGLALVRAFGKVSSPKVKRGVVHLVQAIAEFAVRR
jgi:transcriptional regulator with XRE-family HTH domain